MLYNREKIFFEKLIASLKLNGCDVIDISDENIQKFVPILKEETINKGLLQSIDDLDLLFSSNINGIYTDIHKIIDKIDPLIAEKNNDELYIIMDNNLSLLILEGNDFPKKTMMDIGAVMKNSMLKKRKVKTYAYFE